VSAADPIYVEARRVLLDALVALAPHRSALVVAGAQAVYLRAGETDLALAPYTTDGDLALDPAALTPDPTLETLMRGGGFELSAEPGIWLGQAVIAGNPVAIPVDLIVPEGFAPPGGRRGARLGAHGNRAARRALGLEAALVDKDPMPIAALDPADQRAVTVDVAGVAALLVAKAHKLHDRVQRGRANRIDDKDAADVFRLMQVSSPETVGSTLVELADHAVAGPATAAAIGYLGEVFGRRGRAGIQMASRALQGSIPEVRVVAICVAYAVGVRDGFALTGGDSRGHRSLDVGP
jgi:hypothetical protein